MKRNDFGLWGLELSPEEFARALAALGVFEGSGQGLPTSVDTIWQQLSTAAAQSEGLLRWSLKRELLEKLAALKKPGAALAFAQAWEKFRASYTKDLRFELYLDRTQSYFWIAGQLLGRAVGANSLYVRVDEPQLAVGWNSPLRIGFLKVEESLRLRQQLEGALKSSSLKNLVEFVTLTSERDDCDLLLLPQTLQGALSELLKASWNPKADCVLVLGGSKDLSGRMVALLQAVRSQARTSGVGLLSVDEEHRGEWLKNLITELSHNNALDVALFNANRLINSQPPLLAASRLLIDLTLVSRTAARMGQALKRSVEATHAAPPPETPMIPPPGPATPTRRPTGMSKGSRKGGAKGGVSGAGRRPAPPHKAVKKNGGGGLSLAARTRALEVAAELSPAPRSGGGMFESVESGGGMFESVAATVPPTMTPGDAAAVMENTREAQSIIEKISRKPEERRIQAQVFDSPGGKQQRGALKLAASYAVDVRIGPLAIEWESAEKAFPVEELPPSATGHNLTVIFTEPRVSPQPQVGKLFLPPDGASAPCRFYFHTGEALDRVRARITVLHRNRVIQTAILDAPIAPTGKAKKTDRLTVEIEARVLPNIGDLKRRQTFDAAIVLNHAADGQPSLTAVAGEQASMFSFDDTSFKKTIDTLNGQLTILANDPEEFPEDLAAKRTTELLVMLARHGRLLYKYLFEVHTEGQWLLGKDKKKIQIISTKPESNLPLEFLYDYEAPNENAKLCTYAKKSLPTGQCDKACGGLKNRKTVVCPLGFWGLNRVIERHAFDGTVSMKGTHGLMSVATSERQPLHVLDKALFAASARVDAGDNKGTIQSVTKVLKQKTKQADYVMSWKDWAKTIKSQSPSLLVLLSHTEVLAQKDEMPALEISEKDKLSVVDIEERYVLKRGAKTRPLLMLVGCSTHAPENQFESFVPYFGKYAAIVVSTGATVLASQAAKVATEFVRALSELSGKSNDITFGDVMLDVRRKMLAQGLPMVLCLEAYGDADWYLK